MRALGRLARRGASSQPAKPRRPRAVLLQIDGLSTQRLRQALERGDMPHLKRLLDRGAMKLVPVTAATAPSTPVFQAGLLYGARADVPGFGWFDRELGHAVRMDLPEDVLALEASLLDEKRTPLLDGGVTYGTIWPGGADEAFFNVVSFLHGAGERALERARARNGWDRLTSLVGGSIIAARVSSRFVLELGVGLADFVRWCRHIHTTRFEWRFLAMRLFVSVVMREMATHGAVLDVLRGVPIIYVDYLSYDEYAHRRGPDSDLAMFNLRGVDEGIGKIANAIRAVSDYAYDLYVFSDHGQSATKPFERIMGCPLHEFVLRHVAKTAVRRPIESSIITQLVELKTAEFLLRTFWRPFRPPVHAYVWWARRRLKKQLPDHERRPLDAIEVVTGGSIAHLYLGGGSKKKLGVEEISRRWPALIPALASCRAVGILVGCGENGCAVYHRGKRYALSDRRALEKLEPFKRLGYDVLAGHLRQAAEGSRSGDLVLFGAFAEAGEVAFDFEFGSHGGIGPEELDQFVAHPSRVEWPLRGAVAAEAFYRFFRERYGNAPASDDEDETNAAA